MKTKFFSLLVSLLCASFVCFAQLPDPEVIVYKKTPQADLEMTILRPSHELTKKNRKGTPTILLFYGGGFNGGSIDQFRPQAEIFREKGMIAILVDYRVKSRHDVLPNSGIEDARSAMRYVRENAKELGVNPNMVACSGASSGGHLSASLTFVDIFNDANDNLKISPVPNAVILFCPGVTCDPAVQGNESLFRQLKEDWRDFSPMHNIKDSAPPMIFLVGDADPLVSMETARAFEAKMNEIDADFELIVYEGGTHGFFNLKNEEGKYFYPTMRDALKFLNRIGFIK